MASPTGRSLPKSGGCRPVAPKPENLRDHFDRARGEANAKAAGAVLAKCQTNSAFPYWKTNRSGYRGEISEMAFRRPGITSGISS